MFSLKALLFLVLPFACLFCFYFCFTTLLKAAFGKGTKTYANGFPDCFCSAFLCSDKEYSESA